MYKRIRKIHLYTAFVVLAFLLMYFITGAVIIMEDVFPRKNTTEIKRISLAGFDYDNLLKEICHKHEISGKMRLNEWNYSFTKPGYKAEIKLLGDSAEIKIQKGSFGRTMSDFHRQRGYIGDWVIILWA